MIIGIEAKRIFQNNTGLGNACRNIMHALATNYTQHNYNLYAPKLTNKFKVNNYNNIKAFGPNTALHKIAKAAWRSKFVISQLQQHKVNVYYGMGAELPLGINSTGIKPVAMIYDVIFDIFPNQYKFIDRNIYRAKTKYACKHAATITVISQQTKQDLIERYKVPEHKIQVTYINMDEAFTKQYSLQELFTIKQKLKLPENYLLYVGSVIERKGLLDIAKALHILNNPMPLVIVGNSNSTYASAVKLYAQKYKLPLFFLNELIDNDLIFKYLPAIYKAAQAFIYPSIYEGFGMPIVEAMQSHIPVITCNTSCLPEIADNAALYALPNNANSLAEQINLLLNSTSLQKQLVEKGKIRATYFTDQAVANRVMHALQS
jgi:glycosyltransferase involved in cell wall biosynthesis